MVKSVICITAAVLFIIINTAILFLKSNFNYAINDEENYYLVFQKWVTTTIFMVTIIIGLLSISFAINLRHFLSYSLLCIECLLVIIYSLSKYKVITINGENIKVERLFRKELNIKFSSINQALYTPNGGINIKLKNKDSFEVSFNSENFHKFCSSLLKYNVKIKTGLIPYQDSHVFISKYMMTIRFPKTMIREYYQCKRFFRNSTFLFSARSYDFNEYIEGYNKESGKDTSEFVDFVKNDLLVNDFTDKKTYKETIDGFDFNIIDAIDNQDKTRGRSAYIYKSTNDYLVLYTDYNIENKEEFKVKMQKAIRKAAYEDGKTKFSRI